MSYVLMDESTPKARKPHTCIWCGQKILKGETYRREKSIYDGNWQDHKWHMECVDAAAEHFKTCGEEFEPWENERPVLDVSEKNRLLTRALCEKLQPYTREEIESYNPHP